MLIQYVTLKELVFLNNPLQIHDRLNIESLDERRQPEEDVRQLRVYCEERGGDGFKSIRSISED